MYVETSSAIFPDIGARAIAARRIAVFDVAGRSPSMRQPAAWPNLRHSGLAYFACLIVWKWWQL
jgi:hypothetical protein